MAVPAGSRLGSYKIVAPIGAGGMGEVYKARATRLGRYVALKVLPYAFASDPGRFEQEGRAAAASASANSSTHCSASPRDSSTSKVSLQRIFYFPFHLQHIPRFHGMERGREFECHEVCQNIFDI
jgi:serine/threonine protein kinase